MDKKPKKKKPVEIEGVAVTKASDEFLSSKLGTYRASLTVARIVGAAFFLFFVIFGATSGDMALLAFTAGIGLIFASLFWGLSWPLVSRVKIIQQELDRRTAYDLERKHEANDNARRSANLYKKIAIGAVAAGLLLALVFLILMNDQGKGDGGCRICGRDTSLVAGFDMCIDCYEGFNDSLSHD